MSPDKCVFKTDTIDKKYSIRNTPVRGCSNNVFRKMADE